MNKKGQRTPSWFEAIVSIVVGIILISAIPEVRNFFLGLIGLALTIIVLGLIVGGIIFLIYLWFESRNN